MLRSTGHFLTALASAGAHRAGVASRVGGGSAGPQHQHLVAALSSTSRLRATSLPPPGGPTILLMSGGVESAVLIHHYAHWAHADPVYPLFIDYAQAAAPRERLAGRTAAATAGGLTLLEADARGVGEQLRALHAPARPHVPLPHRNLFLLSVAASYAPTIGATTIALALCEDDLHPLPGGGHRSNHPGGGGKADSPSSSSTTDKSTLGPTITTAVAYSTASKGFLDAARAMLATLSPPLALAAPLQCMSKAKIVEMGAKLPALDLASTWSCAKAPPSGKHCGVCVQCKARRAAFVTAGVEEEAGMYEK